MSTHFFNINKIFNSQFIFLHFFQIYIFILVFFSQFQIKIITEQKQTLRRRLDRTYLWIPLIITALLWSLGEHTSEQLNSLNLSVLSPARGRQGSEVTVGHRAEPPRKVSVLSPVTADQNTDISPSVVTFIGPVIKNNVRLLWSRPPTQR